MDPTSTLRNWGPAGAWLGCGGCTRTVHQTLTALALYTRHSLHSHCTPDTHCTRTIHQTRTGFRKGMNCNGSSAHATWNVAHTSRSSSRSVAQVRVATYACSDCGSQRLVTCQFSETDLNVAPQLSGALLQPFERWYSINALSSRLLQQ